LLTRNGTKLPGVGTEGGIVTGEKDGAGGVDSRDALDDFQLGSIRAADDDHVTDAQAGPGIDGTGDHQRA
jgi:hypothetical protein